MPSGEIRQFLTDPDYEPEPESDTESDESKDTFEPEPSPIDTIDLLEGKKVETMNDLVKVLIEKGGVSTGNMLGIQTAFKCVEQSNYPEHIKGECFSTINLTITLANLYLQMMEEQLNRSKV